MHSLLLFSHPKSDRVKEYVIEDPQHIVLPSAKRKAIYTLSLLLICSNLKAVTQGQIANYTLFITNEFQQIHLVWYKHIRKTPPEKKH